MRVQVQYHTAFLYYMHVPLVRSLSEDAVDSDFSMYENAIESRVLYIVQQSNLVIRS